ncbi:MAG: hypothetical protein A2498_16270 [Lentisphaerae bacterium RIFOXYC12_FULL_60_16]|nr:MAG: hypothetical protein A2498_16270 [Lentisphaerae bacterium RIFOXYC12_FULL_60_16]OGV70368.1 MAG: hypothetical protein A2269_04890 [Lentisphaerae bacterium RIFOXYA12_FULL_60_10]OGV75767.1 MAG: hypothetical protein A2340_09690 [Lentisphaerae bacterium RIFOXYB12_FULL_60_10]
MAPRKRLKLAVIGTGGMGSGHCRTILDKIPEAILTAVCDAHVPNAERAAATFGVPMFTAVRDLVKSRLAEAVIVATPHTSHAEASIACMKAGLHVMSEKPLSETVGKADRMIRAARRYRVAFAVNFQRRMDPVVQAARAFVDRGGIGTLYRAVMIAPECRTQAYYDSGTWRATWKGEGGGVMMNQAPHIMDIFVQLAGMPQRVRGTIATVMHHIEVEDRAEAMLTWANGATGYFYCSTNEPLPGQMIELFGDKGKLAYRDGKLECWQYQPAIGSFIRKSKEAWKFSPECKPVKLPVSQSQLEPSGSIRNFVRHVLFREPLVVRADTALGSLELANAITLSSWTGREIRLPVSRTEYDRHLERMRRTSTFRK